MRLVADHHGEQALSQPEDARRAALEPLLAGSPHGAIYLIGPGRAPIGYLVLSFGWSIVAGGMTGAVDEIYIRPAVRGRGIGSEVLTNLPKALAGAGLQVLHVEVPRDNEAAQRLCSRLRFAPHPDGLRMSRRF